MNPVKNMKQLRSIVYIIQKNNNEKILGDFAWIVNLETFPRLDLAHEVRKESLDAYTRCCEEEGVATSLSLLVMFLNVCCVPMQVFERSGVLGSMRIC